MYRREKGAPFNCEWDVANQNEDTYYCRPHYVQPPTNQPFTSNGKPSPPNTSPRHKGNLWSLNCLHHFVVLFLVCSVILLAA